VGSTGGVCHADGSCGIGDTTCALLGDGTAQCWGLGLFGQLGNGREGNDYFEARPVAVELGGIVDLAIGGGRGCAVVQDGTVWCWGANVVRYLGFASQDCGPFNVARLDTQPPSQKAPCQTRPRLVDGLRDVAHVAVGTFHQCAVHRDQTVTCWGNNAWGQLGNGQPTLSDNSAVAPAAPITGLAAAQVALGAQHTCAVLADGSVACWGNNGSGQLGLGSSSFEPLWAKPTAVPGLSRVKSLSLATATSVALLDDGSAFAWGGVQYVFQEPPVPGNTAVYSPTKMDWISDASGLDTSQFFNCTLHRDRTVSCWSAYDDEYQVQLRNP
jgi:alpha-tubulin suppressor-like RCC1 family protein